MQTLPTPYCIAQLDNDLGVMTLTPIRQRNEPLVYSEYDEQGKAYRATLSPTQTRTLSEVITNHLGLSLPLLGLSVTSYSNNTVGVGFSIDPRHMKGKTIVLLSNPGLSILFVSGIKNAFVYLVQPGQGIVWPAWLKPFQA